MKVSSTHLSDLFLKQLKYGPEEIEAHRKRQRKIGELIGVDPKLDGEDEVDAETLLYFLEELDMILAATRGEYDTLIRAEEIYDLTGVMTEDILGTLFDSNNDLQEIIALLNGEKLEEMVNDLANSETFKNK